MDIDLESLRNDVPAAMSFLGRLKAVIGKHYEASSSNADGDENGDEEGISSSESDSYEDQAAVDRVIDLIKTFVTY